LRHGIVEQKGSAMNGDWGTGGAKLLLTDGRVVFLLLGEARRRTIARMFGVPADKTGLVTVVAAGVLARALHDRAAGAVKVPRVPAVGSALFLGTAAKDAAHLIAGDWSRDTPLFGTLVAVVVLGTTLRPVLRVSFRDVRASAHRARITFDHRYGHLVRRNRPPPSSRVAAPRTLGAASAPGLG
jgi:hypothetical protein